MYGVVCFGGLVLNHAGHYIYCVYPAQRNIYLHQRWTIPDTMAMLVWSYLWQRSLMQRPRIAIHVLRSLANEMEAVRAGYKPNSEIVPSREAHRNVWSIICRSRIGRSEKRL